MPSLAIIIVSWNVRALLERCLTSIDASLANSAIPYEVVVVENASSDDTAAMLRAAYPHVRLLEQHENIGFTRGNNVALRMLGFGAPPPSTDDTPDLSSYSSCPSCPLAPPPTYVLLLNPDTEVIGDAIAHLVGHLEAHPELVAAGPRLCYADGTTQSSRRRFPTKPTFFWESTLLERWWPHNPWVRRYRMQDIDDTQEQRVDWLVGAALLVRGEAIERAGLLDERFFMYSEELEWQHRLQMQDRGHLPPSRRIVYLPQAVVMHYEGRSSEQLPIGRHLYFQRSKLALARLWYGTLFAETLRWFLLVWYAWEWLVEAAKFLVGHRRELRRQRIDVYTTILRNGLH